MARFVHGARDGSGRRVDGGHDAGQLGEPGVVRAGGELPAHPVPALHVHDDPGGELAGDQARAPLQGPGLAEALVLQQQPGHRRDQVEPAGDGLHRAEPRTVGAFSPGLSPDSSERGRRRPDRDDQGVGFVAGAPDADPADDQLARDLAVLGDQAAPDAALLAGPADGGELGVHRGAGRQGDEGGERAAGRVAGLGADQVTRGPVDPLDGAVPGEQEQRNGRVLEHRAQQAAFGGVASRRAGSPRVGRRPGSAGRRPRPPGAGRWRLRAR